MPYCQECGAELQQGDTFCSSCGTAVNQAHGGAQGGRQAQNHNQAPPPNDRQQAPPRNERQQHPNTQQSAPQSRSQTRPPAESQESQVSRRTLLLGGGILAAGAGGAFFFLNDGGPAGESGPPVDDLEISISDVRRPDLGATSATIPFVFELVNTNQNNEIPSPTIDYNVYLSDVEVLSTRETLSTLTPGESRLEEFDVIVDYVDLSTDLVETIQAQSFSFRVSGFVESDGESTDFSETYQL